MSTFYQDIFLEKSLGLIETCQVVKKTLRKNPISTGALVANQS